MNVKTEGGFYGAQYQQFFVESLFKDLDEETSEKLNRCGLGFIGDETGREFIENEAAHGTNVWIAMTAEDDSGQKYAQALSGMLGSQGRALILGNFWNDESKDDIVYDGHITSMYIPFASVSFGERRHTPMDLYNRSGINFDRERKGTLAYQQRSWCPPPKSPGVSMRDKVFDVLDRELWAAGRMPGSALGSCYGTNKTRENGYFTRIVHCDGECTRYDKSVVRYEDFQFVLTMEHGLEFPQTGYITEKMVDALLAGAVPISDSTAVRAQVFARNSYIAVDSTEDGMRVGAQTMVELLGDPQRWDSIRRQPSISEQALRKYFSWHPAVWKSHGDQQRRQILDEILKLCIWR